MQRECKVCQQTMEATHENWVWSRGKPYGGSCRVCKNERVAKARSTEEGREKHNASSVKSCLKRQQTDSWYRLRKRLAQRTRALIHYLAQGAGHKADWSLFGADRQTVFDKIDAQLKTRSFEWHRYGEQWVLDHRLPLALAQSDVELYQLCRLDNCQVLTPDENQRKSIEDQKLVRSYESEV